MRTIAVLPEWIGVLFAVPPERPDRRFVAIDAARGLAALAVVIYHYGHFYFPPGSGAPVAGYERHLPLVVVLGPLYRHGHEAVQLFWTISGFVFAAVYGAGRHATRRFVVSRIARLYPLHLVTLIAVAGLQAVFRASHGGDAVYQFNDLPHFGLHLLMASNWFGDVRSFDGPVWSVSMEVLIYALFWIVLPRLFRWGIVGPALIAGAFLGWAATSGSGSFLPQCGYYFFAGCCAAVGFVAGQGRPGLLLGGVDAVMAAAVGGYALLQLDYRPALLAVLFPAMVLGLAGCDEVIGARRIGRVGAVGAITYGVYLGHFPVQLVLMLLVDAVMGSRAVFDAPAMLIAYVAAVIGVGVLSYRFVERPGGALVRRLAGHNLFAWGHPAR